MTDVPDLKAGLADLVRLRSDYVRLDKPQFVAYLDRQIAAIEAEIAAAMPEAERADDGR